MVKFISAETIENVSNVSVYDLALQMGFYLTSSGSYWITTCPNGCGNKRKTAINKIKGNYHCNEGGGCGCSGKGAISFYSWAMHGEYDNKKHFVKSVVGVAEIMGIPVVYRDGTYINNGERVKTTQTVIEEVEPQSDEICDRVYRRFLSLCPMYEEHVKEWRGEKRQYSDQEIVAMGLKSVPKSFNEVIEIIRTLQSENLPLERVPGFAQKLKKGGDLKNEEDWYWFISGFGMKYFIPVRNELGQIIRLRVATGIADLKYIWFSSTPNVGQEKDPKRMVKGGASSGAPLSIVSPYRILQVWEPGNEISSYFSTDFVICTEGEHKSQISSNKLLSLLIGFPGAGNYKDVLPLLKKWGTKKLAIAIDMDALCDPDKEEGKNVNVFKHLIGLSKLALQLEGLEVVLWCWDSKVAKGLDDLLLQGQLPLEINLRTKQRKYVNINELLKIAI